MNYNFLIVGGDKRISFLAKRLSKDGNSVYTFANDVEGISAIEKNRRYKKL